MWKNWDEVIDNLVSIKSIFIISACTNGCQGTKIATHETESCQNIINAPAISSHGLIWLDEKFYGNLCDSVK